MTNISKRSGIIEPPPNMLKAIFEWARKMTCSRILFKTKQFLLRSAGKISDYDLIESKLLIKKCEEYADGQWPLPSASSMFDIDFGNWKYVDYPETLGKIEVKIVFAPKHQFGGWWEKNIQQLVLNVVDDIITTEKLNWTLNNIHQTIYHELQHIAQSYMGMFKGKIDIPQVGFPSRSIQNKIKNKGVSTSLPMDDVEPTRLLHTLRDEEFYTDLKDEIYKLKQILIKIPKAFRMEFVKMFIDRNYELNKKLSAWEKLSPRHRAFLLLYADRSRFFADLKKYEPRKYRKAVIELLKEINQEIEMP